MGKESYEQDLAGEAAAEKYLIQQGYQILERRWRSQQGEIDLVAKDQGFLVFIEVKSYSFRSYGAPLSAVRKSKRQSLVHAAKTYLYKKQLKNVPCRFDVLTLYRRSDGSRACELYKNAFTLGWGER